MRQAGHLATESDARRFVAWLVTQRIEAQAEPEGPAWAIWVRDEDHLTRAREALDHFRASPQDERYRGADSSAAATRREEDRQREAARRNVVEMRGRWSTGAGVITRRCPLMIAILATSLLVGILAGTLGMSARGAAQPPSSLERALLFSDLASGDVWAGLRAGQIWRLVTPIFIHYGVVHLVFNMLWLFDLGGQIETRRGTWQTLLLVLGLAIVSNIGQAIEAAVSPGTGFRFGGMSGVVYGVFGYVLVKVKFDNSAGYLLSPVSTFIMLLWFGLCIARDFPPFDSLLAGGIPKVANTAHAVGLFAGLAAGYLPLLVRRPSS